MIVLYLVKVPIIVHFSFYMTYNTLVIVSLKSQSHVLVTVIVESTSIRCILYSS